MPIRRIRTRAPRGVFESARRGRVRACLAALVSLAAAAHATHARAQGLNGDWSIQGSGALGYANKPNPYDVRTPRPDVVDDLRPDDIPWRSDEMMTAIEEAIERQRNIANRGGWPQVPGTRMLRLGDTDQRVAVLRRRLRLSGDLQGGSGYDDETFDERLEAAVIRFQERHGLRASGRVDQPTLAALNVTAEQRLHQLELNLSRIAELAQTPPEDRYVLVNIPAFQLEAVERYTVVQRHRVIVGRPERQTPSLKATIKALNFFPNWKVPDSVAQLDIIPRLQKEPEYLAKEQIRVLLGDFNGQEVDPTAIDWFQADASKIKFKQDPGPQNALGLVRIDMQNEHGVYMHDTPLKQLFQQRSRPFSAGCVRVQDVFELVEWLASYEPGWESPGQVRAVLESGMAVDLALTRPVPVYFTYITAWADAGGRVQFRTDIYKRDGAQAFADVVDPEALPPPAQGFAP